MLTLRPAERSDHDAIAALHTASWQKAYRGILSDRYLDDEVEKEHLNMWYTRIHAPADNQVVTLAVENNNIIGFSCIYLDDDAAYGTLLDNLHVAVQFQQSGIGKALMKNCAVNILERGNAGKMYLWVFDANANAKRVYERLNGKHVETVTKKTPDGLEANICRYVWDDVSAQI